MEKNCKSDSKYIYNVPKHFVFWFCFLISIHQRKCASWFPQTAFISKLSY